MKSIKEVNGNVNERNECIYFMVIGFEKTAVVNTAVEEMLCCRVVQSF